LIVWSENAIDEIINVTVLIIIKVDNKLIINFDNIRIL
jgi:hypothetical protein